MNSSANPTPHAPQVSQAPQVLWVHKTDLSRTQLHVLSQPVLQAGQVLLRVNEFALTSNNITYAAFGTAMNYWGFYPTGHMDWGIVPVWGFGTVTQSHSLDVSVGETFYGYYPMGSQVVLTPAKCTPRSFIDAAPHRAALHSIYNQYHRCTLDPFHAQGKPELNAIEALLRPLFVTSWLIDDFLADNSFFGANTALLSSASSKTAYGTAHLLKQRGGVRVIGLTSASNLAFCESLGCYDDVLCYEQLHTLGSDIACVYIDFAGNAALRLAIHTQFEKLSYSCSIGGTHVTQLGSGKGLPGPRPVLFFAPAQSQKRVTDWGAAAFAQQMVAAWDAFVAHATAAQPPWIQAQHHQGAAAVQAAYQTVLAGKGDPRLGQVMAF